VKADGSAIISRAALRRPSGVQARCPYRRSGTAVSLDPAPLV
jgi:hypothetical protein